MAHSSGATPLSSTSPRRQNPIRDPTANGSTGLPQSPKHKCSDSHSSLSSYASSNLTSGCHSRISSFSTVSGGTQPFTQPVNEMPSFETKLAEHEQLSPAVVGQEPRALRPASPRTSISQPQIISPATFDDGISNPERAGSPSDAILITRTAGSNRSSPSDALSPQHISAQRETNNPSFLSPHQAQVQAHSRLHKRTVSAPDFAALSAPATFNPFPSVSDTSAFAAPQQAYTMPSQTESESATPAANTAPQPEIKCMYIENCDTGSQPRKAISHIFGRNKLCTRMIPAHVWVHYCRKHYQRSRYRNGHEYAKLQIDLVEQQIERVQKWSDQNKEAGAPRVVTSWSLAIRKREQKRLEDKQDSRKRAFYDESDDDGADDAVASGTAVPAWLLQKCGTGYSTEDILAIVGQLKTEIHGNHLNQIPDIEILPCISSDGTEGKPKASQKRKTSGHATGTGSTHKRSQSMGVALRPTEQSQLMVRRTSQPGGPWDHDNFEHPMEKRQRTSELDAPYFADRPTQPQPVLPRASEGDISNARHMSLAHRPAYGHDARDHFSQEDYYYSLGSARQGLDSFPPYVFRGTAGTLGSTSASPRGPLPAPNYQRRTHQLTASQFEAPASVSGYTDPLRPAPYHQRSQSEVIRAASGLHSRYPPASSVTDSAPAGYSYDTNSVGYEHPYGPRQGYSRVDDGDLAGTAPPVGQPPTAAYYHDSRQYHYTASPYDSSAAVAPSRMPPPTTTASRHVRHPSSPSSPSSPSMARALTQAATPPQGYTYSPMTSLPPRYEPSHEQPYEQTAADQQKHSYGASGPPHRYLVEDESARHLTSTRR
ncbi:hypothetical protein SODALDRAFT_338741 [Sodiomyces alkalinus F11]|uniref:ORP1 like protein n=1 Tax=Sodiomyces alkalinus (strain CBS 110278 / VKM F-3762 / F11) TaxID=1314773 RepID=A0A3N2Q3R4_SODAK|nr:hypothetical protein SODALDRAFT_338741 [Sodiomyces alkalinus F11]ROT41400.1 hypothetical protein SODALDRAFT_338741 [Sodiomyces alkalinus F11]